MKRITSRDNPTFKQLRLLARSARERRRQGRTLLDGLHLLASASARLGPPELVVVSDSGLRRAEIHQWLASHGQDAMIVLSDALFGEISPVATPAGILAQITIPPAPTHAGAAASCVLLEAIQDAGNVGSILRSAAAAGIEDVFLGPGCAQAWSPRLLRAAMGAHFQLRIHEHAALERVLADFPGLSLATRPRAEKTIYQLDLRGPLAWVFGNEGAGLSPALAAACRQNACIPMAGGSESLNVAAAAAVCLFEELRQKSGGGQNT